ncbi:MAG: sodium:solute symporter family transporter [Pirellulaceae bacterium]
MSTPWGVLAMGGENAEGASRHVFMLSLEFGSIVQHHDIADLPTPSTSCGAALIGDWIYYVAGQVTDETGQTSPSRTVWRLPLEACNPGRDQSSKWTWERIPGWPIEGEARGNALITAQHDGFTDRLYVIGGRRFEEGSDTSDLNNLKFLSDVWSFDPSSYDSSNFDAATDRYVGPTCWRRETDSPRPLSAGTAVPFGQAHIIVPGYADGSRLRQWLDSGKELRDFDHPGFPNAVLGYHTVTRSWVKMGEVPVNHVTTPAISHGDEIILISGEVRPRVRTRICYRMTVHENVSTFRKFDLGVVIVYLAGMLAIGAWFSFRNKTTDDYFRGGKQIHWFVAGCSIFATMLSSITYMAVPAKAFSQNWVYLVGNFIILAVAPIAIYLALPFFRRIDATSAYEYLEKRFSWPLRLIGSGSFSLFHVFRMGVVLALAALALASILPLTPAQCVLVMGVLSIVYCTLGGIEAVVWTDTIQTFVLIAGALACLYFAWTGAADGSLAAAAEADKFRIVNFDFGSASFMTMAVWVVIIGGFGQNISSYTADQAVVQRYMTTPDSRSAARSIWLNGLMAVPAGLTFFALGTALWMFYRSKPDMLDPTIQADRIMPLFITQQLPLGLAGLVVAGIFAAAQSTVSTSMNSGATTIVTDFLRPLLYKTEKGFLGLARIVTLLMGIAGTLTGLLFVDENIKSLFDEFIGILGLFLGVLAGLFILGATTRRANSIGSLLGAATAIVAMGAVFLAAKGQSVAGVDLADFFENVLHSRVYLMHSYLYAVAGIAICFVVGYLASLLTGGTRRDLAGLTLYSLYGGEDSR